MYMLKDVSCYVKAVLAVMIGENVIKMLPDEEGGLFGREALNWCWKWIQEKDHIQICDLNKLCDFLDAEDGIDLLYYIEDAENEVSKKIYIIIMGVVSYITAQAALEKKIPLPQYLESSYTDEYYNDIILNTLQSMEQRSDLEKKTEQMLDYCNIKIKENGDTVFFREEMLKMF